MSSLYVTVAPLGLRSTRYVSPRQGPAAQVLTLSVWLAANVMLQYA